jgi:hypothetical protein
MQYIPLVIPFHVFANILLGSCKCRDEAGTGGFYGSYFSSPCCNDVCKRRAIGTPAAGAVTTTLAATASRRAGRRRLLQLTLTKVLVLRVGDRSQPYVFSQFLNICCV